MEEPAPEPFFEGVDPMQEEEEKRPSEADRYRHVDPDNNPTLFETTASTFGGVEDVVSGQDNGLFSTGGASVIDRETGQPITESQVEDVRRNPDRYVTSPEYYAAFPRYFYEKGLVKAGQPIRIQNPNTGKIVTVITRDRGPSAKAGIDLSPYAMADLYDGKNPGLAPVLFDMQQMIDPNEPENVSYAGHESSPVHDDHLASGELIRQRIAAQDPQVPFAGDMTEAATEYAEDPEAVDGAVPVEVDEDGATVYRTSPTSVSYPRNYSRQDMSNARADENGVLHLEDGSTWDGEFLTYKDGAGNTWQKSKYQKPVKISSFKETPEYKAQQAAAAKGKIIRREDFPSGLAGQKKFRSALQQAAEKPEETMMREVAAINPEEIRKKGIDAIPVQHQADIKAISEYRYPKLSGFALKSPYYQKLLSAVSAINPDFDVKNYDARQKIMTDFSAGKSAENIRSLNTALGHINTAFDNIEGMDNTRFPYLNRAKNTVLPAMGFTGQAKAVALLDQDLETVATEVARVLTGGVPSVEAVRHQRATLNSNMAPSVLKAALAEKLKILSSRLSPYVDQYKGVMGKETPYSLLYPEAQAVVKKLGDKKTQEAFDVGKPTLPEAKNPVDTGAVPDNTPADGHTIGERKWDTRNQVWRTYKGGDPNAGSSWPVEE